MSDKKSTSGGHRSRPLKRKFSMNQHTVETCVEETSASAKKLGNTEEFGVVEHIETQYCFLSFVTVFQVLSQYLQCKKCKSDVEFRRSNQVGLGFLVNMQCSCSDVTIPSCPKNAKSYEVNRRLVFVMRLLGSGLEGIRIFCSLMDLTDTFSNTAYYGILNNIEIATKAVYDAVIRKAVKEEKEKNEAAGNVPNEFSVSGDGTWAKRGFSSLLGVVSLIGKFTGKVLDLIVKSSHCAACNKMSKQLSPPEFDMWYEGEHEEQCTKNHEGSAGKMEVDGVIEMFQRSEKLHGVKYRNYIGDGDSKTFTSLNARLVYGVDFIIHKLECVLHVGKRMFRRLKDAKKLITQEKKIIKEQEQKKAKESDKKPKKTPRKSTEKPEKTTNLTGKIMKEMATYYSLAIQRHPDSVDNMQKEIWACYYHKVSTDSNPRHEFCDISWCKYLQCQAEKKGYSHKPPLDPSVLNYVKPIYEDLTNNDLLKRCLGKNTQNNNESFNSTIWHIVPKSGFQGKEVVETCSWIAACVFNEGFITVLKIMETMNIEIGRHAISYSMGKDSARISQGNARDTEIAKKMKKQKQNENEEAQQFYEAEEGLLYGPGIAD